MLKNQECSNILEFCNFFDPANGQIQHSTLLCYMHVAQDEMSISLSIPRMDLHWISMSTGRILVRMKVKVVRGPQKSLGAGFNICFIFQYVLEEV